ncbi:MAG: c-type cytochrome [Cyclobacteriaceae bacterium]
MKELCKNILPGFIRLALPTVAITLFSVYAFAQEIPDEADYFPILPVLSPQNALLEVGGLTVMPDGNLALSTRRGDIFIVENPSSSTPYFRKFASGLHEVLGLVYKNGAFYCAQRGELTKITDTNKDGKADVFETIYAWPLSGNYHEYSYGPHIAPDGSFFVTTNLGFFSGDSFRGRSAVPWRGWALKIFEDGRMEPWATGMRSPCGLGIIDGELFYTDNQGEYIASGGLWHVKKGDFMGNPAGLAWTGSPGSPLNLTPDDVHAKVDPRLVKDAEGKHVRPVNIVDEKAVTLADVKKDLTPIRLPAVWLPYGYLGISTSEPISIPKSAFGPFGGQVLVGDQGMSIISRVFLEKVKGEYQGASFAFRSGFNSGVVRLAWAKDGSLFVGETRRGWGSSGEANEGLERLVWNNEIPFEMKAVRAMPDGFEVEFTKAADRKTAQDLASYSVESFIYKYHPVYGSPPVNIEKCPVRGVKLSDDGMKARIVVDNLRPAYIHTISLHGIREKASGYPLLHPTAYYTLNNIPEGKKLAPSEFTASASNKPNSIVAKKDVIHSTAAKPEQTPSKVPGFFEVKGLLVNYTCTACHTTRDKQIGPGYVEIAERNYSNEEIVKLIHQPKPENWPDYETAMPPMPQVTNEDAMKIAAWINSLDEE